MWNTVWVVLHGISITSSSSCVCVCVCVCVFLYEKSPPCMPPALGFDIVGK
jgi:hypothetical protein